MPCNLGSREPKLHGKTYNVVGRALGTSGTTYLRAKAVVKAAEDMELPEDVRDVAQAALAQMNETGEVKPAYSKVRRAQKAAAEPDEAETPEPPQPTGRALPSKQAAKILPRFISQLTGIAGTIDGIDFSSCRLAQEDLSALDASVRVIVAARKTLKGSSQ